MNCGRWVVFGLLLYIRILICDSSYAADLPLLANPVSASGATVNAIFRGGVQINGREDYFNQLYPHDLLTITADIYPDPAHVNQPGEMYLVVRLGADYYMRTTQGDYISWDLNLANLQPTVDNKNLAVAERLTILDGVTAANLALENVDVSIYLAYSSHVAPGELYYSGTPLAFSIQAYTPMAVSNATVSTVDTEIIDSSRQRTIPVLIYLPESRAARPVILFSHGLGGSRFAATYLGKHWAARGYVVIFMQHPGSDESILVNVPPSQILSVMNQAANAENSIARIEDVSAVIDQLEAWQEDQTSALYQRLDLSRVGMSGHSFGARTTQSVSGQRVGGISSQDPRIDAALVLSPSTPDFGSPEAAFDSVTLPWMLMTGTLDSAIVGNTTPADRMAVFPALAPGGKYELVLFEGEHHAFTDNTNALQNPRNPAHHPMIMALTTAFWDTWLLGFASSRQWLEGTEARSILQPGDSWQFK